MTNRKLIFDAVPVGQTAPLRLQFKSVWATIRRDLLKDHGAVCMACGYAPEHGSEIEGHEVYSLASKDVIRPEEVLLLCRKCHHTVHIERSVGNERTVVEARRQEVEEFRRSGVTDLRQLMQAGRAAAKAYRAILIEHYCKVNDVSTEQAEDDRVQAMRQSRLTKLERQPTSDPTGA